MPIDPFFGSLVSAGASFAGGLLNSGAVREANAQNARIAQQNRREQRAFAEHGLTWKIDDALKNAHKVHPIYSLGASTPTYTPVSANFAANTAMGNAVADAGQAIGRGISATATNSQRIDAYTKAAQALSLEKGGLENELLRTQLASEHARLRQAANPPFPGDNYLVPGQTQSGNTTDALIKNEALKRIQSHPDAKHMEPGAIVDTGHARTSGGLFPVPGSNIKERIEDNWYQETMHFLRNNLLPAISPAFNDPPKQPLKEGHTWVYDPVYGYKQVRDTRVNRFFRNNIN